MVRKDGVVSELLWADFAGGEVAEFDEGAEACSALGSCTVVGDDGVVIVGDVPFRPTPERKFVEMDTA